MEPSSTKPSQPPIRSGASALSIALVAAQITLIALLASPLASLVPTGLADVPGSLCLVLCVVLAAWAFRAMRGGTFTVLPEPRNSAQLITRGPYGWIRHPMYTAVLLGGLGVALTRNTAVDWIQCGLLLAVMFAKIRHEEALLSERYEEYREYRSRTAALLPGVY